MDDGRYVARACAGALGYTSKQKPQIAIDLEITQGESAGQHVTWYGYFSDAAHERTFAALRTLGWEGDDLSDLTGIDKNEVSITLKSEEYEGKWTQKVAWINPLGGLVLKDRMDASQLKAFAASMRGAAIASRSGNGASTPKPKAATGSSRQMREPGDDPF